MGAKPQLLRYVLYCLIGLIMCNVCYTMASVETFSKELRDLWTVVLTLMCLCHIVHVEWISFSSKKFHSFHFGIAVFFLMSVVVFCLAVVFNFYTLPEEDLICYKLIVSNYYLFSMFHFIAYFLGEFVDYPEEENEDSVVNKAMVPGIALVSYVALRIVEDE